MSSWGSDAVGLSEVCGIGPGRRLSVQYELNRSPSIPISTIKPTSGLLSTWLTGYSTNLKILHLNSLIEARKPNIDETIAKQLISR